jgi:hypothetical protein
VLWDCLIIREDLKAKKAVKERKDEGDGEEESGKLDHKMVKILKLLPKALSLLFCNEQVFIA